MAFNRSFSTIIMPKKGPEMLKISLLSSIIELIHHQRLVIIELNTIFGTYTLDKFRSRFNRDIDIYVGVSLCGNRISGVSIK